MNNSIKLALLNKFLGKEKEEGFSLIELVVVVSVLAVLTAIALPTFSCMTRKARATTALAAIRQIQTECFVKKEEGKDLSATFMTRNLQGYEIESDESNSCAGNQSSGLIRAIPNQPDQLPTFILATNTNELNYEFKGLSGTKIIECLPLICGTSTTLIPDLTLDPIHGDDCNFRTAMWHGNKLSTGCYGDPNNPNAANGNGWLPDPCALTSQGCESTSFWTSQGTYPCIAGEDQYQFRVPDGFPPVKSRNCNAFDPEPPNRNCYCWPPREDCNCD